MKPPIEKIQQWDKAGEHLYGKRWPWVKEDVGHLTPGYKAMVEAELEYIKTELDRPNLVKKFERYLKKATV